MRKYNTPKVRFAEYNFDVFEKICSTSSNEFDISIGAGDLTGDADNDGW